MKVKDGDNMYQRFAQKLTSLFLRETEGQVSMYVKKITENEEEQKQIFNYGAGLLLSSIVTFLLSLVIAGLFGRLVETLIFYVFFLPLRSVSGGYHARSYLTCTVSFLSFFLLGNILIYFNETIFSKTVAVVAAIIVVATAPVEDENKPLSVKKKKKMRVVSWCIVALELSLVFVVKLSLLQNSYIVWAMVFVAGLLLSGKIKNLWKGSAVRMRIKEKLWKFGKGMSNGALTLLAFIAVTSASQTSWWFIHQPEEPKCLKEVGEW